MQIQTNHLRVKQFINSITIRLKMNETKLKNIKSQYSDLFELTGNETIIFSPGRINVLGEHIDYNDGMMLPAAIDLGIYLIGQKRNDHSVNLHASDYKESVTTDTSKNIEKSDVAWANYILGVIAQFQKRNIEVPGFNLVFEGDLPIGAGLSSSAALECGVATFINHIAETDIDKIELLKMAQKSEHEFAGVQCGIMDQFASMMSIKDHLILLDSASLDYQYLKIDLDQYSFVLIDSDVKHSLVSSEYNLRREECQKVLSTLKQHHNGIGNFRDCTLDMLSDIADELGSVLYKRGKYVIEEIGRVKKVVDALNRNDIVMLGELMYETHLGLSRDYEVSCKELDFLCGITLELDEVIGSRMIGGGFGGCTLNLIKKEAVDVVTHEIAVAYKNKFKIKPKIIPVNLSSGTTLLD